VAEFARIKDSPRLPHPDLEGLVRDVGVHPAAVIVSGKPVVEHVPLWTRPADGAVVTQFDRTTCEALGLPTVDVVGSAELALVADALRGVVLNGKPEVDLGGVPPSSWVAYLEAHCPAEYLAAVLTAEPERAAGVAVLPPDVNESRGGFTAVGAAVRYGLGAVRFVGVEVVEAILRAREEGRFVDFFDFLRRVDAVAGDRKVVEALVLAGAFDSFGHPRKGLHLVHATAVRAVLAAKKAEEGGQFGLFGGEEFDVVVPDEQWGDEERAAAERAVLRF
jgi:DNA polymerase III alpha subunit